MPCDTSPIFTEQEVELEATSEFKQQAILSYYFSVSSTGKKLPLFSGFVHVSVEFLSLSLLQDSDVVYVPCSGLTGENLVGPCKEPLLLKWYNGPSLLDRIGTRV